MNLVIARWGVLTEMYSFRAGLGNGSSLTMQSGMDVFSQPVCWTLGSKRHYILTWQLSFFLQLGFLHTLGQNTSCVIQYRGESQLYLELPCEAQPYKKVKELPQKNALVCPAGQQFLFVVPAPFGWEVCRILRLVCPYHHPSHTGIHLAPPQTSVSHITSCHLWPHSLGS